MNLILTVIDSFAIIWIRTTSIAQKNPNSVFKNLGNIQTLDENLNFYSLIIWGFFNEVKYLLQESTAVK